VRLQMTAAGLVLLASNLSAQGLPVSSELVRRSCGACHQVDSQQRMSRISYVRKTPEGWEETIQRMARLHGFRAAPADARKIEQYLSASHGLVASELERIAYSLDGDDRQEQVPNEAVKTACTTCHSFAKIAGQRRTREEWLNIKDFLLALFPTLVYQHRFEDWMGLCDEALPWLADQFPLDTPEWRREKDRKAPGEGRWLLTGHQLGKGDYVGSVVFRAASDGGLETEISRQFDGGGASSTKGKGLWLGAFAWRGSGSSTDIQRQREVFHVAADGNTQRGRWFPYDHPELGATEVRSRVDDSPQISGILPRVLRRGATVVELNIYGANVPPSLGRSDINLGDGILVDRVSQASSDHVVLQVRVAPDAKLGRRDLHAGAASKPDALVIYDKIDYILVLPEKSMARLGGVRAVKKFIQFEAHAFSNGPDGIAGNSDDLDLGMVKASWSIEDLSTSGTQNARFVGGINQDGLFTPAREGPNSERPRSTNNAGEVWVKASYTADGSNVPLTARAYVLVSVPDYRELITP
jgi:quinohemoprotein amine dehydrogenase